MKKLVLYTSSVLNDGSFVDGGTTVDVGDEPGHISADRAKEIADSAQGASETAANAAERDNLSQLDHDGDGKPGGSLPGAESTRARGARASS